MIEASLKLGKQLLESSSTDAERKDKFLQSQAIAPKIVTDDKAIGDHEIVIDLDTKNKTVDIYLGDQLTKEDKRKFFAFKSPSNSKKFYFATNNLRYHLISIDEMIRYIQQKMDNEYSEFAKYLLGLREQFYKESEEGGWLLNPNNLKDTKRKQFEKYHNRKNDKDSVENSFQEFVSKEILGSTRKDFVKDLNIFTLKFDGIRAHEKDFAFYEEYINIVFYNLLKRFFDSSKSMVQESAICSSCQKQKKVTGKIDIPAKFYITDKPTFFENVEKKNAYRSFSLCEDCYQELMVGIDHIQNKYGGRLFGTNYYLIPRNPDLEELDEKMIVIKDILVNQTKSSASEFEKQTELIEEIKHENLRFDFLFHWTPPGQGASFVVAEYISDIEYQNLDNILDTIRNFESGFYSAITNSTVRLYHIHNLLFPNFISHSDPRPDLYRKDLLHFFKVLIKNGVILYNDLIHKFLFICKKTKYRKQDIDFSFKIRPLQMHMLLKLFYKHANLQGLNTMNTNNSYTQIPDNKIIDFFNIHSEIYGDNSFRQGLVLLGILMNQILKEQGKQKKSSTVIDKINFDGMPVRRLPHFINEITEYLNLKTYDLYRKNSVLYAAMIDRMQSIENSTLTKDEVVFYIMTGISLSTYLGYKYNQEQKIKEDHNE